MLLFYFQRIGFQASTPVDGVCVRTEAFYAGLTSVRRSTVLAERLFPKEHVVQSVCPKPHLKSYQTKGP